MWGQEAVQQGHSGTAGGAHGVEDGIFIFNSTGASRRGFSDRFNPENQDHRRSVAYRSCSAPAEEHLDWSVKYVWLPKSYFYMSCHNEGSLRHPCQSFFNMKNVCMQYLAL